MTRLLFKGLLLFFLATAVAFAHQGLKADTQAIATNKTRQLIENTISIERESPQRNDYEAAQARNGIDTITFAKMTADNIPVNGTCDDATFLRRAALLLTGRLPDPDLTRSFLADGSSNKRDALIDTLMASQAFRTHWSFYFQEMFQSNGSNLRLGTTSYAAFFDQVVAQNTPLDEMAYNMMTATGDTYDAGPANFTVRAVDNSRVPLDRVDNWVIHASEKFLGIQISCISCHDGANHLEDINLFLADQKREQFWGMAAFAAGLAVRPGQVQPQSGALLTVNVGFVDTPGYNAVSDTGDRPARNGGLIAPNYLFSDEAPQTGELPHAALARLITEDRQFARNFANRFWGHLFGLALVEPLDGFDPYRIDPEQTLPEGWEMQVHNLALLDYLADYLIQTNYDWQGLMRHIMQSATFQMDATFQPGNWQDGYAPYYTRFLARRLPAETVYDSIQVATGVITTISQMDFEGNLNRYDYAHEFIDPGLPRGNQFSDVANFLTAFGRGNRIDIQRTNEGSIAQALMMMNSEVISDRLVARDSRILEYINSGQDTESIIRNLYLDVLVREPSDQELAVMLNEIENYSSSQDRVASVAWLLLNYNEFMFVY